jgi:hypothetical protein
MDLWLKNGTTEKLRNLRVQNCVMLKSAPQFSRQTSENKVFKESYVAVPNDEKRRWIITAWAPATDRGTTRTVPACIPTPSFPTVPRAKRNTCAAGIPFTTARTSMLNWNESRRRVGAKESSLNPRSNPQAPNNLQEPTPAHLPVTQSLDS